MADSIIKNSIALIGFMGVGKTTVGQALARKLSREFIEIDKLIKTRAGKEISAIFTEDGEIAFRDLEIQTVKDIAGKDNIIIDCGGGVVLNQINIARLKTKARIVYLSAAPDVLFKRLVIDGGDRPLLAVSNKRAAIKTLLKMREPFYSLASDIRINTSGLSVEDTVALLMDKLKEDESFNL